MPPDGLTVEDGLLGLVGRGMHRDVEGPGSLLVERCHHLRRRLRGSADRERQARGARARGWRGEGEQHQREDGDEAEDDRDELARGVRVGRRGRRGDGGCGVGHDWLL
uniref:Uncharacterized protein n=1 Tax=Janibacter limosus TaxID=53458 RepID=A0AC61U990_9MICO|nr:hypothetical protein [Janibacter limosus]